MATVSIRISAETRRQIESLARERGLTPQQLVAIAVEEYRRALLLCEANAAYAADGAAESLAREMREWDSVLGDGLEGL